MDYEQTLEELEEELTELREENKTVPIIVEGDKDIAALRKFALCFQKAEDENNPERSQKLGVIAAELEKAIRLLV